MNTAQSAPAYGLWILVIINSAIFIIFAFSFFKPKSNRDWRTFGNIGQIAYPAARRMALPHSSSRLVLLAT